MATRSVFSFSASAAAEESDCRRRPPQSAPSGTQSDSAVASCATAASAASCVVNSLRPQSRFYLYTLSSRAMSVRLSDTPWRNVHLLMRVCVALCEMYQPHERLHRAGPQLSCSRRAMTGRASRSRLPTVAISACSS